MPALPPNGIITADDYYDIPVLPGREYLLVLCTDGWGSTSVTTLFNTGVSGGEDFVQAADGAFNSSRTEGRFIAPNHILRLGVELVDNPIKVNLRLIQR